MIKMVMMKKMVKMMMIAPGKEEVTSVKTIIRVEDWKATLLIILIIIMIVILIIMIIMIINIIKISAREANFLSIC